MVLAELVNYYGVLQICWLIGVACAAFAAYITVREKTATVLLVTDDGADLPGMTSKQPSGQDGESASYQATRSDVSRNAVANFSALLVVGYG